MAPALATNSTSIQTAPAETSVNNSMENSKGGSYTCKGINSASGDAAVVAIVSRQSFEISDTYQTV